MIPTMSLPPGAYVDDVGERIRVALEELDAIEPTRYSVAHWLTGAYRRTLVLGGREHWPLVLNMATDLKTAVADARAALASAREAARRHGEAWIERLPARVHVVRVRDESGATGFAPIDVRGATLVARFLSLLVADFWMRPERYLSDPRAA